MTGTRRRAILAAAWLTGTALCFTGAAVAPAQEPRMPGPAWRAQWIAAHALGTDDASEPMPLFRKSFRLTKPVARAVLYASGLGQDELRINGNKVGNDELTPGWSDYRKTVYYDRWDLTRMLRPGANTVGVMLGNGMFRVLKVPGRYTKLTGDFGEPRCMVQLEVEFTDGSKTAIQSDASWKTAPGPIVFSHAYGGEDYDARREVKGWDEPGFDDSAWKSVAVVDGPGGVLRPEAAPPVRVLHTYEPVKVTHPTPDAAVYDLGQNFAGWPEIRVAGAAGAKVKLIGGELLDKDGLVSQHSTKGPQWYTYTLRGDGEERWHPRFSYWGFRYVQVEITPAEGGAGARLLGLRGQAVHTSSEQIGSFASSNELLNRIHTLILRSIENNAVSLFTDCPHREKLGWLEEAHLMAPSMLYDFDFSGLYKATARNIEDDQKTDGPNKGMVASIAPQYVVFNPPSGPFNDSPEWGSTAVLGPWYLYRRTGDKAFLEAQYPVMRAYADYLGTRAHDGIVDYGLGDWYDIGPGSPGKAKLTTAGVTATAIYYQDLVTLADAAAESGRPDESRAYSAKAQRVRDAFNARFFDGATGIYDKGSQTAQAMPLALGMVPEGKREAVLDALVQDIRAHENHVTAGDVGFHYVVDALLDGGRSDVLLDMLERTDAPSYGYQLAQGATALTEAWDANPGSSQDHLMLGHAEEWFYRGLGGINVDAAALHGDERIVLSPQVVGDIQWVKTRYKSRWGEVESDWKRDGNGTEYFFRVPAGAATIEISAASADAVAVNGMPLKKAQRVALRKSEAGKVRMAAEPGEYRIRVSR